MNEQLKKFTAELKEQMLAALKSEEIQKFIADTKAAEDTGTFDIVISTPTPDRAGESIIQNGWETENYQKNPVVLWAHNYQNLPVAITDELYLKDGKTHARGRFAPHDFAQDIRKLYDAGFIFAASVGFIPLDMDGKIIKRAELLEWSFVPVPCNAEAVRMAKAGGMSLDVFVAKGIMIEDTEKGAVADEIAAEDEYEKKRERWKGFQGIIWAFADVYFSEETKAEQFQELLKETIGLLNSLTDESKNVKEWTTGRIVQAKAEMTPEKIEKILIAIDIKAGREISGKNIDALKSALCNVLKGAISINGLLGDDGIDIAGYTGEEEEPKDDEEKEKDAQKGKQLTIESVKEIIAAAVKELQGGEGNSQEDGAAPKPKSNNSESGEVKELDSFLEARQILRAANNAVTRGLEQINEKIREGSK